MLKKSWHLYAFVTTLLSLLLLIVTAARADNASNAPTAAAMYRITFTSNWNNTAHPHTPLPGSAHWSNLVGATHSNAVTFWEAGELATAGMERVAEAGSNGTFQSEVDAAIAANNADSWIQQGLSPFFAPDSSATVTLTVQPEYPLLTLATMIAPSPDWFAGVSNLSLQNGNGSWRDSFTLDLYPYDAGTEEGTGYSGSNPPTDPAEAIHSIRSEAPFSSESVATLTVTLLSPPPTFDQFIYLPLVVR